MSVARAMEQSPIMELNTTPLIDVLLVLLVMFIITVPIQSHSVKFDLPQGAPTIQPNPLRNLVEITPEGAILFNATRVDEPAFRALLRQTQQMTPVPELHLRPAPTARYEVVDETLAIIKRERVSRFGFVGNEDYRLP